MIKRPVWTLGISLALFGSVLTGCGQAPASHHAHTPTTRAHHPTASQSRPTITPTSSPPSHPIPQPTPVVTQAVVPPSPSFAGSAPWTPNAPAGVGSPAGLKVSVTNVRTEGSLLGQRVLLLQLTLTNITSSLILFTLNDFTVSATDQSNRYSQNDAISTGLSRTNSLFPYPLTPRVPEATTLEIPSGATVHGAVTVVFPPAPNYRFWLAGAMHPAATFPE